MKSKGLGDSIEKITKATGIKAVVDKIAEMTETDCGCDKRKSLLNKWFPARGVLLEDEYRYLEAFFERYNGKSLASEIERNVIYQIYNRANKLKEKPTSCPNCLNNIINNLRQKYDEYRD